MQGGRHEIAHLDERRARGLNAGDETPGTARYATWWSACDEAVIPQQSAVLNGAQNTQTACLRHSEIYQSDAVHQAVREWVRPTRYGR